MTRFRLALCALLLALCVLPFTMAGSRFPMESVCFYFQDGTTLNIPLVGQPSRGDNLAIRDAVIHAAVEHRARAIAAGTATGREGRMVLAAMTEQWTEGGLSCVSGYVRSGMKAYNCTCNADGGGCVRVIVQ